ncbi:hypothetical protein LI90_2443 [Carbonactinospora thermoautotrophica]|uniref:Uncharacterized protein n=1 Tax=Carbonactinospora thermoautotrophica TaxID=1469144 RepID=A0A132MU42_9ACTN|nr:hypothetical protein LI90_2443 [Carbonactinospora thermoautotrophica]
MPPIGSLSWSRRCHPRPCAHGRGAPARTTPRCDPQEC